MTAVHPGGEPMGLRSMAAEHDAIDRPVLKKLRQHESPAAGTTDTEDSEQVGLAALVGLGESQPQEVLGNVQQQLSPSNTASKASFEAHKKAERKERNRLSAERHRKKQREHTENLESAAHSATLCSASASCLPVHGYHRFH